ncbi:MAG: carbonic anhydrase [Planctomycetota bacterium]
MTERDDSFQNWMARTRNEAPLVWRCVDRRSQAPAIKYLWIGCSDPRPPAHEIVGLDCGELIEHRNLANVVDPTDSNCEATIQYAVDELKVEHIIVCGHYGCSGIRTALGGTQLGALNPWLRNIGDVYEANSGLLNSIENAALRLDTFCELNVIRQAESVCRTSVVKNAWQREQTLDVHAWIYQPADGLLCNLDDRIRRS